MRNLILLIKQFYSFFIFLVLELICLIIVFRNNSFQQASYINSSRSIAGSFYDKKSSLVSFMHLKEVNDSLLKENMRLKTQLGIVVAANPLKDTSFSKAISSDSVTQTIHYNYIPAKILNNTVDQKINYLTLNVGRKQGIEKGMAVISANGIVGRISHVSDNYSVVLSLLSSEFKVTAVVSDGTVGRVMWDGADPELVTLSGLPQSVKMKPLDSVYTSGLGIFPENILIGRVVKALNGFGYKVWLSTNFRKLHFVYVINEKTNIEKIKLEDSTQAKP